MGDEPEVWRGHEALRPYLVPLTSLTPDPENARTHPERNLATVKASLERFGQVVPILHRDGLIVAGHGRAQAAEALGWTHLAALGVEGLSDAEAKALALMDNKSGELAEWDFEMLGKILGALPPELHDFTGFADFERAPLMAGEWQPPATGAPVDGKGVAPAMETLTVTKAQHEIIEAAVLTMRERENDESMTFGRALELICADWMS